MWAKFVGQIKTQLPLGQRRNALKAFALGCASWFVVYSLYWIALDFVGKFGSGSGDTPFDYAFLVGAVAPIPLNLTLLVLLLFRRSRRWAAGALAAFVTNAIAYLVIRQDDIDLGGALLNVPFYLADMMDF